MEAGMENPVLAVIPIGQGKESNQDQARTTQPDHTDLGKTELLLPHHLRPNLRLRQNQRRPRQPANHRLQGKLLDKGWRNIAMPSLEITPTAEPVLQIGKPAMLLAKAHSNKDFPRLLGDYPGGRSFTESR
jgi:hypothetical protein